MRLALLLSLALALPGCFLLETPCGRMAGSICTIPGEESACTWLRDVPRDNQVAQDACEKLEPVAAGYAREPKSLVQQAKWMASRAALGAAGFVGEFGRATSKERLDKAGEKLKGAAEQAGEAAVEAGEAIGDVAREAGDTMQKAVEGVKLGGE